MKKKVWVVLGGRSDSGDVYQDLAESIKQNAKLESSDALEIEVDIIENYEKAKDMLEKNVCYRPSVIIFVSCYRIEEAREIRKMYRNIEVLVLAGVIPEGEIGVVPKSFLFSSGVRGLFFP